MIPPRVQVWGLRLLVLGGYAFLCSPYGSGEAALGIALAWGVNGLSHVVVQKEILRLPRFLEPVHALEPVLYRWLGVGWIKRIVESRAWLMLTGFEPWQRPIDRREFLDRTELSTKAAEVGHDLTFVLVSAAALYFLAVDRIPEAVWILVVNVALNGYPVMLQRTNRWRIQRIRAKSG